MTNATRKPRQSRGVAMRFASRKNGTKKTLCQRRGRGGVKVRRFQLSFPCSPLTLLPKTSTLPMPATKALISPHSFLMKSPFHLSFYVLSSKLIPLSCLPGTKYDHEGQKTSTRHLQKENPIVCYSVDKAEEDKKGKLFLLSLWT